VSTTVHREIVLPVTRERAWELLTDAEELRGWLADDAELEPEVGGAVRADEREGIVESVLEEERIAFQWGGAADRSRVVWTLDDDPRGTRLTIVERRLTAGPVAIAAWGPRLRALARASALCPA
jgi:uncharacterized protein YndB with AHSA1/START domain